MPGVIRGLTVVGFPYRRDRPVMRARHTLLVPALAILLWILLSGQVLAAAAGAAPGVLYFDSSGRTQTLHVINTGNVEAQYRVYADGEYEGWFVITPQEFSLSSGADRDVNLTVSPPEGASGLHTASIRVVAFEPSSALKVGAGVKVPAHVTIEALPPPSKAGPTVQMWIVPAIIIPVLLAATLLAILRRRQATDCA